MTIYCRVNVAKALIARARELRAEQSRRVRLRELFMHIEPNHAHERGTQMESRRISAREQAHGGTMMSSAVAFH
jgi:hypothetical protein